MWKQCRKRYLNVVIKQITFRDPKNVKHTLFKSINDQLKSNHFFFGNKDRESKPCSFYHTGNKHRHQFIIFKLQKAFLGDNIK